MEKTIFMKGDLTAAFKVGYNLEHFYLNKIDGKKE
jgi:hypothetical protein